jgi:RNA polymerase sigma-70 factor (ECF subfamily)
MTRELSSSTLAKASRGDHQAFRDLVVCYQRLVHAVVSRMLVGIASAAEVDELAQDTFLRVYRGLPGFNERTPGGLKKWIVTIAARLAIDARRRRRAIFLNDLDEEVPAPDFVQPDASASHFWSSSALERAVAALPPDQREILLLRVYHDFDYQELANAFGIEIGTVKSRLARARCNLRRLFEEATVVPVSR